MLRALFGDSIKNVQNLAATSNTTVVIPAGFMLLYSMIENTTNNPILGGLKVGTTSGGVDVAAALAVGAGHLGVIPDALLLKRVFSMTNDTTLYIQAATAWNSASLNLHFALRKVT